MSKRPFYLNKSTNSRKKRKTDSLFGAPTADDVAQSPENTPSSGAPSQRVVDTNIPSLSTLCLRVFTKHFQKLSDERHWEKQRIWVKRLPDSLVPKLFANLRAEHPRLLGHEVIVTYFFRGHSVYLNNSLPLKQHTLTAIPRVMSKTIRELVITDVSEFGDAKFAAMLKGLSGLNTLVLSYCSQVGPLTAQAAGEHCKELRKVNFSHTSVTVPSLASMLESSLQLEVLKLAGVNNISDGPLVRLFATVFDGKEYEDDTIRPLSHLRNLKLQRCTVSEIGVLPFFEHCPMLSHVDLGFTLLRHIPAFSPTPPLEKISLLSSRVPPSEIIDLVSRCSKLKKLNLGALGAGKAFSADPTGLTLDDETLLSLTDAMKVCTEIESINLVQNSKLGSKKYPGNPLEQFIRNVGRRCRHLNLSSTSVRSEHLIGLEPEEGRDLPALRTLILNKTVVDDNAAPWISCCPNLEEVDFKETRISSEGLMNIIDSCPRLSKLELTGCRGVRLADRRRFFEVWEEHKAAQSKD